MTVKYYRGHEYNCDKCGEEIGCNDSNTRLGLIFSGENYHQTWEHVSRSDNRLCMNCAGEIQDYIMGFMGMGADNAFHPIPRKGWEN